MEHKSQPCNEVQNLLALYVGADLEPAEMDLVAGHLNDCTPCRVEALSLLGVRERIARLADEALVGPGPDVWSGVRARLWADGCIESAGQPLAAASRISGWRSGGRISRWRSGGLAAAAALVVSVGVLQQLGPLGSTPAKSEPPLVAHEPRVLPDVSGVSGTRGAVMPVSSGPVALSEIPKGESEAGGLRRAGEDEPHLIDSALPIRLEDVLQPVGSDGSNALVGGRGRLRRQ